ncbi:MULTISPECIES: ribose 1,5-bisphosphate isomerase [Salinibaculum]|uniref:ribose 1,5-bisphosphate isomerase n=1 Tax=Salinibaculum TaxID=2732368 RepID=UPI0030D1C1C5
MGTGEVSDDVVETAAEIAEMDIRGAATIARAAADALQTQAVESTATDVQTLDAELRTAARRLNATRPTAVSLPNALRYVLERAGGSDVESYRESVVTATGDLRERLESAQADLGRVGANRLRDGDTIMTHCHSTAVLSVVEAARDRGLDLSAVVKETRPREQGRITARQLRELGVPVTYIVDSAAHRYLDEVDHVCVGADSIAADGTVVNKIGTNGLAVSARERGVEVVVAAQTLKLDPATLSGHNVDIEFREETEILGPEERDDIGDIEVVNPAFDATPPRYIDAIVTEEGQFPPESIVTLMRDLYGTHPSAPWEDER